MKRLNILSRKKLIAFAAIAGVMTLLASISSCRSTLEVNRRDATVRRVWIWSVGGTSLTLASNPSQTPLSRVLLRNGYWREAEPEWSRIFGSAIGGHATNGPGREVWRNCESEIVGDFIQGLINKGNSSAAQRWINALLDDRNRALLEPILESHSYGAAGVDERQQSEWRIANEELLWKLYLRSNDDPP